MKKFSIAGALSAGLLMLASSFTQAAAISGQGTWETTLQGRDLDGNLATAEAYYDTVLGITWLGDANYAKTTGYDADGKMTWAEANTWAAGLNPYGSSITGWRLPVTNPVNGASYNYGDLDSWSYDGSTDFGFNISAPGSAYPGSTSSELAYLFYNMLGNDVWFDSTDMDTGCGWADCLTNSGSFANIQSFYYWSATGYANNTRYAWDFRMADGLQDVRRKTDSFYAWAVHDGDVGTATVPIPAATWLFSSGLLGLGAVARKRQR